MGLPLSKSLVSSLSLFNPRRDVPDLAQTLRGLLDQVPLGRVTTYGRLAEALGDRIASRWVGHFVLHHAHRPGCPCHRVVRSQGELGLYVEGTVEAKRRRLREEGIEVIDDTVDLDRFGFDQFQTTRPLDRLRELQQELACKAKRTRRSRIPPMIGGVDVSYTVSDQGVAAYALVEVATGDLVWSTTVQRRIRFPYVTSYLTFRELPILLELIEQVRAAGRLSKVVLVDGTGMLHPRRAGIASHLGVAADVPTIGVTKKLLCGQVDGKDLEPEEARPIVHQSRTLGVAIRPTAGSRRPLFVSPGHRVDLAFTEILIQRMLRGRRLPEPLYWADRLSRAAARERNPRESSGC